MLQVPLTQKAIAKAIGIHESTISRELSRNSDKRSGKYMINLTQRKAIKRQGEKARRQDFSPCLKEQVLKMIKQDFSPEQISGRSKLCNEKMVSHETIYRWIWEDKRKGGTLYMHLRRTGRKYRHRGASKDSRGIITNRVDISEGEDIVNKKERFD